MDDRMPKANVLEARMIAQLVKGIVSLHEKNHLSFEPHRQLGIIVPFRRQIALVRVEIAKLLPDVAANLVIDTVERYQGSQRDTPSDLPTPRKLNRITEKPFSTKALYRLTVTRLFIVPP